MESQANKNIKVMLVEDHVLTRLGLKALLERTEDIVVVGEADNGLQAISEYQRLLPDVVLMDVGMPVMDGIEASKKITTIDESSKIIMLTSHDNEEDLLASMAAGACGYCLKDVEPDRLYTAIRSVSSGDVWLDSHIANKIMQFVKEGKLENEKQGKINKGNNNLANLPEGLSTREMEVLELLVEGHSNQEIADKLFISLATAKTHVRNILNKLAVDDRTQAAVQALRRGLV